MDNRYGTSPKGKPSRQPSLDLRSPAAVCWGRVRRVGGTAPIIFRIKNTRTRRDLEARRVSHLFRCSRGKRGQIFGSRPKSALTTVANCTIHTSVVIARRPLGCRAARERQRSKPCPERCRRGRAKEKQEKRMPASCFRIATSHRCVQPPWPEFSSFHPQPLCFHILMDSASVNPFGTHTSKKSQNYIKTRGF